MIKKELTQLAYLYGYEANYSGNTKTMYFNVQPSAPKTLTTEFKEVLRSLFLQFKTKFT